LKLVRISAAATEVHSASMTTTSVFALYRQNSHRYFNQTLLLGDHYISIL